MLPPNDWHRLKKALFHSKVLQNRAFSCVIQRNHDKSVRSSIHIAVILPCARPAETGVHIHSGDDFLIPPTDAQRGQ